MNYKFDWLNDSKEIVNPTIKTESVNLLLVDEDGIQYGVSIKIKDLNIDEKVLKELEKYKV